MTTRAAKLLPYYEEQLKMLRFKDVTITTAEKDGLDMLIKDVKPKLFLIGCDFYDSATPFLMGRLLRKFPDLNVASISTHKYPVRLGAGLVVNGVKSFLSLWDGIEQFHDGFDCIREGGRFISETVQLYLDRHSGQMRPSKELTDMQIEIIRFVCNGYTNKQIANRLHMSVRNVIYYKNEIYNNLKIENKLELTKVALKLGLITEEELIFDGGDYEYSPLSEKKTRKGRVA